MKQDANNEYHYRVKDVTQANLEATAQKLGNLKLARLASKDAEHHLRPGTLKALFTEREVRAWSEQMSAALYELGDLSGSGQLYRAVAHKPFTLSCAVPHLKAAYPGMPPMVVEANPYNVASVHENFFLDVDTETHKLLGHIRSNNADPAPRLGMTLELPGTSVEDVPIIDRYLDYLRTVYNHRLTVEVMDLATAMQSAVQRSKCEPSGGRDVILRTSALGPNGDSINILSSPGCKIRLVEGSLDLYEDTLVTSALVRRAIGI